jgi:hypothetical protein
MSRYRVGIVSLPLPSRLNCAAPWNIKPLASHLFPLFTTGTHYIENNGVGQAGKWIFSFQDKELAAFFNEKQICLKSNELRKSAKVVCDGRSIYLGGRCEISHRPDDGAAQKKRLS